MPSPLRVAQVLGRMDYGGIEAEVLNYYRHIDRSKVQFDFYCAQGSALPQREELQALGAGLYPVPTYSHPLAFHRALYQAFRERGYKIVHAQLSTMSVFALFAAWRAGVPVRICHNHSTAHRGEGAKTLLKYLLRPLNRLFATDRFACGQAAGRWMYGARAMESGRVTVWPNAIETARFAYDPAARAALRAELGIPQHAVVIGHIGRFIYQKNHAFLLDVMAQLRHLAPQARLLLVGEGEWLPRLRARAEQAGLAGQVVFAGARRDAAGLYSAMDVFCLPSFYEGMPLVAWEAQANGLPCLFSEHIPAEAAVTPQAHTLPLSAGAAAWAQAALELAGQRAAAPDTAACDIAPWAEKLGRWYCEKARQNG